MKNYLGIDLGTTNSTICSYNGVETRIWKSPEHSEVTPSAIYIDKLGNKYVGQRAYDLFPQNPDNAATLFKRLMGTSTPILLKGGALTMTPEQCSSEVLKLLFGYLPKELKNHEDAGTVVTVPAAFNQMQKNATVEAAEKALIGEVALMQEPVAAVISVMREMKKDGMFLVYDLGGGTLDIAIAESIGGKVSLLAHGGIAMCGGRDFDRLLVDKLVLPWLRDKFSLAEDFTQDHRYRILMRMAAWAAEKAKIALSRRKESLIYLSETEAAAKDLKGTDIFLDVALTRESFNSLIAKRVEETIEAARETLSKAGLQNTDMEQMVFVGGPTIYKPLRDKVARALGIKAQSSVNPLTAVAEGAAIFAESIDWRTVERSRKENVGKIAPLGELPLAFTFIARTPKLQGRVMVKHSGEVPEGLEFQIDSRTSGWTSGKRPLTDETSVVLTLAEKGENLFDVKVFDQSGNSLMLKESSFSITRTAATVEAIPASYSICIEVLDKLGGESVPAYLVKAGDALPVKNSLSFKAGLSLRARQFGAINFKIWEGEIESPITDNRFVGMLQIRGTDFDYGIIPVGADLKCDYEILDSGFISLSVSIPAISGTFKSEKNFYSRQEGQKDYTNSALSIVREAKETLERINDMEGIVADPKLEQARQKLRTSSQLDPKESDPERAQEAMEDVLKAKKLMALARKENLKEVRQRELDNHIMYFNQKIRLLATNEDISTFENIKKAAQRATELADNDFEVLYDTLRQFCFNILWRYDWYVYVLLEGFEMSPERFKDQKKYQQLMRLGQSYKSERDILKLRQVVSSLLSMSYRFPEEKVMFNKVNIVRG